MLWFNGEEGFGVQNWRGGRTWVLAWCYVVCCLEQGRGGGQGGGVTWRGELIRARDGGAPGWSGDVDGNAK